MGPILDSQTNANVEIRIQQQRKVSVETNVFLRNQNVRTKLRTGCFQVGAMGVKRGCREVPSPPPSRHTHFHTMHPKTLEKVRIEKSTERM